MVEILERYMNKVVQIEIGKNMTRTYVGILTERDAIFVVLAPYMRVPMGESITRYKADLVKDLKGGVTEERGVYTKPYKLCREIVLGQGRIASLEEVVVEEESEDKKE